MKKSIIVSLLLLTAVVALGAQNAVVREASGKVEARVGTGAWSSVTVGQTLPRNATISTGFGATATLEVANSRIEVAPLTRLTIEELADDGETVSTGVFVPLGRVRASVEAPPDRSTDFTIRTAQSTAAVRGTEFETNGWQLTVSEGIVEFANLLGEGRNVSAQESSSVADGSPSDPLDEAEAQANLGGEELSDPVGVDPNSGTVTVRW
ncbi:MAG: FecR family protein [Spirochaetota bacterium]